MDPVGRWAIQSVGAAVANLELALALRLDSRVTVEVFPDSGVRGSEADHKVRLPLPQLASRPAAVVHWAGQQDPGPDVEAMFGAIAHRFTSRAPFAAATLSERQWRMLRAAGAVGDIVTDRAPTAFTEAFLVLTAKVDANMVDDPAYLAELQQWVDRSPHEGIPSGAAGAHDRSGHFPGRDFSLGITHGSSSLSEADFELRPQLAVLHSSGADGPTQWLHAGMALQRLALRATSLGLRVGILGQVIEDDQARERAAVEFGATVDLPGPTMLQQVVRIGYSDGTPRPAATQRRPLSEVISTR